MRLPIPQLQRRAPQEATAGPQTSGVPAFGLADLGAAMFNVGANAQHAANVEAEQAAREAQQRAARIEHEQRKARVIERIRDDRLKWLDEMQRRKTEAPEGADGFTPKALADFDTYRKKAAEQIPDEEERGMYDGLLGDLREHVGQTALVFQSDSRARYRARVIAEGADKSARLVAADPAQLSQVLAQELALIAGADGLAADAKADLAERTRDTLAWSAAQTIIDRDPDGFLARAGMTGGKTGKDGRVKPSDPAKAAAAVQSDPVLSNLPPQRLQQAIEKATMLSVTRKAQADVERERAERRAEAAAERLAREQDRSWLIVSDRLRNGIPTDPSAPELRVLAGSPYAAEYQARAGQIAKGAAVAALPLDAQRAQLDTLKAQRLKGTNKGLEHEIEQREQILRGAEGAYKDEPLRAAAERGLFGGQAPGPLDVSSLDTATNGLVFRVEQAKLAEAATGAAVSPFLRDEARIVGQQLQALPWDERGKRVAALAAKMTPGQAQAFARQVNPDNRALALEIAAGTSRTASGATVAQYIARGQQWLKDKPQDGEKADAVRNTIATELGDALTGPAREDVLDSAVYAYMGLKQASMRNSPGEALRIVLGGPLVEHNGKVIPVPAGIDDLRDNLRAGKFTAPAGPVFVGGQALAPETFRTLLPDAQLEPAGFGRYYIRAGDGFVTDAQRRPVAIRVIQ